MCKYYRWNISFALKLLSVSLVLIISGIFLILLRAAKLLFLSIFKSILGPTYKTRVHIFSDLKLVRLLITKVCCDILKNNTSTNQLPYLFAVAPPRPFAIDPQCNKSQCSSNNARPTRSYVEITRYSCTGAYFCRAAVFPDF